ncbi:hypothetical protein RE428_38250 [Marinobacter nanhaiticus D15-8W]|uniref:DUF1425 domain-containing protein n=1 Tax=Marinobacter nanhaiticus D15-8W TaxID=626887 RepID=N6W7V7_9GAMM|nr:YcfL family protein [Marinobacter nanhaiticus]ENO16334.1 DUF1425 domain-containing protein [Marinobacter nanhaiticus D15-8W]BES72807.1 hypothetical protein RE428_38250 [Marinobacter nanhaiticus D15-8W]
MRKRIFMLTLALASTLIAACAPVQPKRDYVPRDDLKVDPEIRQFLVVEDLLSQRIKLADDSTLLRIQFSVQAYQDTEMEWAVTWFDDDGMVVPGVGEGYRTARVLQNQTRFFTATAPHERAVSYQLHLREDREP